MRRKILSIIISLSMLTAAVPSAFAAPDTVEGENAETEVEVTETEVPADAETEQETETETTKPEPETADTTEAEEPEPAADTPEPTGSTETAAPEEPAETASEPDISLMSVVSSGTCGDDLTYTLDDSGTLTISGTGAMTDYSSSSSSRAPWYSSRSNITSVVIEDGVTSIGSYAFYDCSALESITIPDSVTSIDDSAFYNTGYYNEDANWENGILYIDNCLIDAKTDITKCTIKNYCRVIANSAFYYCSALVSITIPDSVTSIGSSAFDDCDSLTDVYYDGSFSDFAKISIDSGNSVFTGATLHCGNKEYETWGKCGVSLAYYLDYYGTLTISGTGETWDYGWYDSPFYNNGDIISVVIEDSVTSIGNYAFRYCSSLTSVTIGSGLTSIGSYAFA